MSAALQLASHLGTSRYPRPRNLPSICAALSLLPESTWPHSPADASALLAAWSTALAGTMPFPAAPADPYATLLVSLHLLHLSGDLAANTDGITARLRFDLNKFQHREIERQESLRPLLGLSLLHPLSLGLAEHGIIPNEDALRHDLRWLQALQALAQSARSGRPPPHPPHIHPTPEEHPEPLKIRIDSRSNGLADNHTDCHISRHDIIVSPWPFNAEQINLTGPAPLPTAPLPLAPLPLAPLPPAPRDEPPQTPQGPHPALSQAIPQPLQATLRPF